MPPRAEVSRWIHGKRVTHRDPYNGYEVVFSTMRENISSIGGSAGQMARLATRVGKLRSLKLPWSVGYWCRVFLDKIEVWGALKEKAVSWAIVRSGIWCMSLAEITILPTRLVILQVLWVLLIATAWCELLVAASFTTKDGLWSVQGHCYVEDNEDTSRDNIDTTKFLQCK